MSAGHPAAAARRFPPQETYDGNGASDLDCLRTGPRLVDAALAYARHGLPVLPLRVLDKRPSALAHRGVHSATVSADLIREWWAAEPWANVGVAAGHGVLFVDVDVKRGVDGHAAFKGWCDDSDVDLTGVAVVDTPSGGRHYAFRTTTTDGGEDVGCRAGWLPGVDVRGVGGYVVAPPSGVLPRFERRPGDPPRDSSWPVQYTPVGNLPVWDTAPAPQVLLDALRTPSLSTPPAGLAAGLGDALPRDAEVLTSGLTVGQRNDQLHRLACRWWRLHRADPALVWVLAYGVWNATSHDDFPWAEASRAVESARRFIESTPSALEWWAP